MNAALLAEYKLWLMALALASVRIQVAFAIIPLFNSALLPRLVRASLATSLSLVLVPPLHAALQAQPPPETWAIATTVLKESFVGLLIGFGVAVLFWAIEAVGFFIDNQRGASIASTLNPLTGNDTSPLGMLFNQAFIVYFMVAGGFLVLMSMLYASFQIWPVLTWFPQLATPSSAVYAELFERLVRMALLLSSPAIVAMLLAELGLALVSRFAPQLQVFFLAMPIKSGMALFVLVVYVPTLFGYIGDEIARLPELITLLSRGFR